MWPSSFLLLLFGCLASALFTPLSMRIAVRAHAIDFPDGGRKTHARPTPRLGGLAVFLSAATLSLFFLSPTPTAAAWLTGGALLCALGVSDDIFSLTPRLKMTAMVFICLLPVCFGLAPTALTLGELTLPLSPPLGILLALLWLLLLTNAYNLIDGLDSLAASQGMVSALFLSLSTAAPEGLLLCGALFGFLPYNRPALRWMDGKVKRVPTRTFLGDTGALFIGYSLAVLSLGAEGRFSLFLLLLFALPLYELFSSVLRRVIKGKNPFAADGDHLHHRMLKHGYSPSAAAFLLFLYAILFASLFFLAETLVPFF